MNLSARQRKRSIQHIRKSIDQFWDSEMSELTRFKRLIHLLLRIGVMVARDFINNLVNLQAMALAFKTLLSLAPLLAVIFSILKGLGVHSRMEPALAEALAPLGEKGQEITTHLISFVDRMSAGALGSIGLVTLFFTVMSLMGTIEEAFNRIWHVRAPRKLTRKFSDYLSVILVGPVLVASDYASDHGGVVATVATAASTPAPTRPGRCGLARLRQSPSRPPVRFHRPRGQPARTSRRWALRPAALAGCGRRP